MILDASSEARIRALLREAQLKNIEKNIDAQISLIRETMQYVPDNLSQEELLDRLQQVTSSMNNDLNSTFTELSKDIKARMEVYFGKQQ